MKTKVEAAKKAYEDSTKATGANSEQSKALKEELDKLEQEFKANETAIGKTETALANQTTKTNASKASLVEMESELEKVNKELKNHKLNEFASGCDKAGQKMESFGKKMSVVSAGIAAIGAASIAAFKELDEGYDTIVTKTGATGEALEGLTASADNVFGSMPEDMSTVGEAIGEVNTRFHSTGEELESLSTQFIQFSSINGTNVTQSVDQVDKIMKAWNIDTSQTGNLLGLLTSKAQETGISVDKLESYVLDNNSAFKEMGLSLPQAINLMAQFDANGVDSTTALAGLKKALQNATAEGKSMDVALEETIGSIKNAKTDTEALQIATELFGKNTRGLAAKFHIDSAATSREEIGNGPHYGTVNKMREVGIPVLPHRARQMTKNDYKEYDYLIGMDEWNIRNMKRIAGDDPEGKIHMLLEFSAEPRAIADPWYTGNFDVTYADVVEGCEAFFEYLKEQGEI